MASIPAPFVFRDGSGYYNEATGEGPLFFDGTSTFTLIGAGSGGGGGGSAGEIVWIFPLVLKAS